MKDINYKEYVEKLNSSPIFTSITKNFDYERIGLQILKDEEVIKEFTSHNQNGKITKVEEKLNDPDFVVKIQEKTLRELISPQVQELMKKDPIKTVLKYKDEIELPFIVKLKLAKLLFQN